MQTVGNLSHAVASGRKCLPPYIDSSPCYTENTSPQCTVSTWSSGKTSHRKCVGFRPLVAMDNIHEVEGDLWYVPLLTYFIPNIYVIHI